VSDVGGGLRTRRRPGRESCLVPALFGLVLVGSTADVPAETGDSWRARYPAARREAVTDTLHGMPVADPYRWLENSDSPDVVAWEDAQNVLTRSVLDSIPARSEILARVRELWSHPDQSPPMKYGERHFFWRTDGFQERWVFCVQETLGSSWRVLIDPNALSEKRDVSLSYAAPSEDGNLVAYGLSEEDTENPVLHVLDVNTARTLPDTVAGSRQDGVSWTHDGAGFFYSRNPAPGTVPEGDEVYYRKVYYHALGSPASDDALVFEYPGKKEAWCGADVSEEGRYLLVHVFFGVGNELYVKDLEAGGEFLPVVTGFDHTWVGAVIGTTLLLQTDWNAPRGRVLAVDLDRPAREHWQELVPEGDDVLEGFALAAGRLYLTYSHNTYARLEVLAVDGTLRREIRLPTAGSARVSGRWKGDEAFISFSSLAFPRAIYRYDFGADSLVEFFRPPIAADFSDMLAGLVWYDSKDGTRIPMYLIHRRGIPLDGTNPTLLSGYGGFRAGIAPRFSATRAVWLERGGVLALPGLRGGSEFGEEWHRAGMLENKQNVFDDFIAAGEWLVANGYTSPEKLAISGGSNGGLLVGAVEVQRPDLCKAVWCGSPLLDMVRYHLFSVARYWIGEYGSSEDPTEFKYLYAYSPYHNVADGVAYPATLVGIGSRDARTDPMHARKMVAALQHATVGDGPILLSVRRESGHGVEMAKTRAMNEVADRYAFLMWQLGVVE
jgi:prolyl oligopeptidase